MTERPSLILIAEDSEENRIPLKLMLELYGFRAIEAIDGREAVERVRRDEPDLILMDISLPILDGLAATREIRADAGLKQSPIIISAYEDSQTREEALAAGGTDFISKPIEFDALKSVIERCLNY